MVKSDTVKVIPKLVKMLAVTIAAEQQDDNAFMDQLAKEMRIYQSHMHASITNIEEAMKLKAIEQSAGSTLDITTGLMRNSAQTVATFTEAMGRPHCSEIEISDGPYSSLH